MRTFIEHKVSINVNPTPGVVHYHQNIYSKINCKNNLEKQRLSKDLEVQIIEDRPMLYRVVIITKNVKIQLDTMHKKQEELAKEIYKITENIEFRMNWEGKCTEILNHNDIINHWRKIKSKLENRYKGQAIERYLRGIERKILNHDKLLSDCMQYRLYGLLFNDLFGEISDVSLTANKRIRSHNNIVYQLPLDLNETVLLEKEDEKKVTITISGSLCEEQLYTRKINNVFKRKDIKASNGITLDEYKGAYTYNKNTGIFDTIALDIVTSYGTDYKKVQHYQLTQKV